MTEGTSQGLFIVVAIVIFGIFVSLSYTLFGKTLQPQMVSIFEDGIEQARISFPHEYEDIGLFKVDKTASLIFGFSDEGLKQVITELVIPSEVDGIKIKGISEAAFRDKGLDKLSFEEGIETLGKNAFYKNNLTTLTLPNSLISTGEQSFRDNKLHTINFGTGLKEISRLTFYGNKFTKVVIPSNVEVIGYSSFRLNRQLKDIEIGSNVRKIDNHAFSYTNISEIYLPESVNYLGRTFISNSPITKISISKNIRSFISENPDSMGKFYDVEEKPNIGYYGEDILNYY